jgi:acetyl-CoA C-acetyltransferase
VAQIVEITDQLRGKADKRQVVNAKYGLAQSVGGTGSAVTVSILGAI